METPALLNYDHPGVKNQINKAENPTYRIENADSPAVTKTGVLYSQLAMIGENGPLHKGDKYKLFEMPRVFRLEDKMVPLKNAREFTMSDMHELCSDLDEAMSEAYIIHKKILAFASTLGFELYVSAKVSKEFFDDKRDWLTSITRDLGKEMMIVEIDYEVGRYVNMEYHINIPDDKPMELSAFQLDFDNPDKFNLRMSDGSIPTLIHSNFIGLVERFMYAMLTRAICNGYYDPGLAPEQIRIVPQTAEDVDYCVNLASEYLKHKCRVAIDDRFQCTEERIYKAQMDLIPFILVVQKGHVKMERAVDNISDHMKITQYLSGVRNKDNNVPDIAASYPLMLSQWPELFCSKF